MTAMRPGQLPTPDTEAFRRHVAELKAAGLPLTPARLRFLAAAHEFGWFDGQDGFLAMLWDAMDTDSLIPPQIRDRRRTEDMRRPAAPDPDVEDRYHHTLTSAPKPRPWRLVDEGRGFHCEGCHTSHGRYISPEQSVDAARDHVKTCPEVRDV